MAIKHQEICYAEEEKELYSNSSFETLFLLIIEFIEELSKKYVLVQNLKETSENEEFLKLYKENLLFHYHEKLLYQNDKLLDQISKQVLEFAKDL